MGVSTGPTLINHMKFYFYLVPFKQNPSKTEFHWQIYDEPLYPKNFIPFSHLVSIPVSIKECQRKRRTETKQYLEGPSQIQKPHGAPIYIL